MPFIITPMKTNSLAPQEKYFFELWFCFKCIKIL